LNRTGTVVLGQDVRLGAVSILHGGFSVQITTDFEVSQPQPLSQGKTAVVGQQDVQAKEAPVRRVEINEGAKVEQLVNGLQNMGATARDIADSVHPHPTLSETLMESAEAFYGTATHTLPGRRTSQSSE
jgi:flagellar basal body P-ring protein FlgI